MTLKSGSLNVIEISAIRNFYTPPVFIALAGGDPRWNFVKVFDAGKIDCSLIVMFFTILIVMFTLCLLIFFLCLLCCMCFYYYHFFGEIKMYIKLE